MARRDEGAYPQRSVTEEQRSQAAFSAKTLGAADLSPTARVGSAVTARCGDAPASPPWPPPKSLAAGPHGVFNQALNAHVASMTRGACHTRCHGARPFRAAAHAGCLP